MNCIACYSFLKYKFVGFFMILLNLKIYKKNAIFLIYNMVNTQNFQV